LILNERNIGFAGANNQGLQQSQGEYIALLNSDAIAEPQWLEEMLRVANEHPGIGMVACKILTDQDPTLIDGTGMNIYPDGMSRARGRLEKDEGQYDRQEEVLLPSGCAALYRKSMLDRIGHFDDDFFAYCEDIDLGLRARLAGWSCVYAPRARVRHIYSGGDRGVSTMKALNVERNHVWVAVKNFPLRLLIAAPLYSGWRWLHQAGSLLKGTGMGGRFISEHSSSRLLLIFIRAYVEALGKLPVMLMKRRRVQGQRKLTYREFRNLLDRFRISIEELTERA